MPQPDAPADERRAAWAASITALVVVAAFVSGKTARDAILLANFDIKMLPLFVGISAVISLPIILVAGKQMTQFGPGRLMPVLNLMSAALAVVEWLLLERYPRPIAIAIFLHLSVSGAVLVSGFWSVINERFDIQSAKRHIGRIGMGATLGGILGGLIAQATAVYLTADNIMLVLAGLQLSCAATLFLFRDNSLRDRVVVTSEGTWFAVRVATRSRLLRNVGIVIVLGAIAAGVLDYVFKADIVARSSKDELLRSLAVFYTVTSVLTAIVQLTICAPLIARLGVPRSVAALPLTVTAFGLAALAVPTMLAAAIARGAEAITRNSIYRAGYELLYAPLPEADKRPAKLVLDVGADRIGDFVGAQLVAAIVFLMAVPRSGLLIAAVAIGAVAVVFALRLPRAYTEALEDSLVARGSEPETANAAFVAPLDAWHRLGGLPSLGQAGDLAPLPLRIFERTARRAAPVVRSVKAEGDILVTTLAELRSADSDRVRRALAAELTPELAAHVVGLVGRDDVGRESLAALRAIAPRCTGMIVDALLDPRRDVILRRRLPEAIVAGEPSLAAWGLWRGLGDPSYEVRYRCGAALAQLAASGHLAPITTDEVFETVRRELVTDPTTWNAQHVVDDLVIPLRGDALQDGSGALGHVFTVLGLVLPVEPLRIALHAIQTDDSALRETALEYLESILPADVRAQLWPFLQTESVTAAADAVVAAEAADQVRGTRTKDELIAALSLAYPSIEEKLRQKATRA